MGGRAEAIVQAVRQVAAEGGGIDEAAQAVQHLTSPRPVDALGEAFVLARVEGDAEDVKRLLAALLERATR